MNVKNIFFAVLLFCLSSSQLMAKEIIACIDDYPPYQILGNPPEGLYIDSLKTLSALLNRRLVFFISPNFARCAKMLEIGRVDVIVGFNKSDERDQFAFYAPFKKQGDHVVIMPNNVNYNEYNDFDRKIIGIPRGTTYFEKFDNDQTLNKISIQNVEIGIQLLLKKRIDMILTSKKVATSLIDEISLAHLKTAPLVFKEGENISFFGFSKKNRLELTENDIISITTKAYLLGDFEQKNIIYNKIK
jgi:polar amino acid transport system substrate-binding protein